MRRNPTIVVVLAASALVLTACAPKEPPVIKTEVWPKPINASKEPGEQHHAVDDRLTAVAALSCVSHSRYEGRGSRSASDYYTAVSLIETTSRPADTDEVQPPTRFFRAVYSARAYRAGANLEPNCGYPWNGDAARQLFNDNVTKMAASRDDADGHAHVGYVDQKGKFHDLSGYKKGSYGYADHQIYPVFIPGTDRIAYRVGKQLRSVRTNGVGDRREGVLPFEGSFYYDALSDKPVSVDSYESAQQPDGLGASLVRDSVEMLHNKSVCAVPVGITAWKEFSTTYVCINAGSSQLNRISSGKKPTPLLPRSYNRVTSAVLTTDATHVVFVAQNRSGKMSLYTVPVSGTRQEPKLLEENFDATLLSLRQYI